MRLVKNKNRAKETEWKCRNAQKALKEKAIREERNEETENKDPEDLD